MAERTKKTLNRKKKIRKSISIDTDKEDLLKKLKEQNSESESELIDHALEEYLSKQKKQVKKIVFFNQKGGVAKTTSVMNIGAELCNLGKKVLLIDMDSQGNLTKGLGVYDTEKPTVYELLKGEAELADCIEEIKGMELVPATLSLAGFEYLDVPGKEFLLRSRIEDLSAYDYVLIDCGPNLTKLTLNALTFANRVYVPIQTEYFAMEGVAQLMQTIDMAQNRLTNKDLKLSGVFCTMFDGRRNLDKEVRKKIEEYFSDTVLSSMIRENVKLAEAPSKGLTIFEYAPNSNGATDYRELVKEIVEREEI